MASRLSKTINIIDIGWTNTQIIITYIIKYIITYTHTHTYTSTYIYISEFLEVSSPFPTQYALFGNNHGWDVS